MNGSRRFWASTDHDGKVNPAEFWRMYNAPDIATAPYPPVTEVDVPYRSRKEPEPPKTRSGRSKRDRLMKKHGDYEPVLWTRIDAFHGLPVQAVAKTHSESHLDPMGPQCRYYVRRHHHAVAYALSAVVTAQANELKSSLPAGESNLLTPKHKLGLMGATKLKAMRLMEKIYRQPKRWWLGLDVYAQHIAVLDQVGHEVLVEWLRTYKPAP